MPEVLIDLNILLKDRILTNIPLDLRFGRALAQERLLTSHEL